MDEADRPNVPQSVGSVQALIYQKLYTLFAGGKQYFLNLFPVR